MNGSEDKASADGTTPFFSRLSTHPFRTGRYAPHPPEKPNEGAAGTGSESTHPKAPEPFNKRPEPSIGHPRGVWDPVSKPGCLRALNQSNWSLWVKRPKPKPGSPPRPSRPGPPRRRAPGGPRAAQKVDAGPVAQNVLGMFGVVRLFLSCVMGIGSFAGWQALCPVALFCPLFRLVSNKLSTPEKIYMKNNKNRKTWESCPFHLNQEVLAESAHQNKKSQSLGVDSSSILFNLPPFQKPAGCFPRVLDGFPSMGKVFCVREPHAKTVFLLVEKAGDLKHQTQKDQRQLVSKDPKR